VRPASNHTPSAFSATVVEATSCFVDQIVNRDSSGVTAVSR
jgi:hypothetical protein